MAINFPDSPSLNDSHVEGGRRWKWNGTVWERIPASGAQGVQGAQGATGAQGVQGAQGLPAGGYANKNLIVPDAYAVVGTASSGTGLGMNWGAYNSSNGRVEFTFHYAQSNATYYVHTNREQYATHNIEVSNKTTTGFRTRWTNSDGSNLSPATFAGVLIVYASDPIEMVGIGSTGNTGAQGHQGRQGAQGVQGAQGATGAQGHQGVQGAQGHQGRQGAQGVQGAVGAQGAQGHQGHQGVQGATGAQGHQGVQGAVGAQGAQGRQGAAGAQGAQGAQGVQGADGNFGGATFDYTFDSTTSDADPGAGKLRLNNALVNAATVMYIDDEDGGGTDIQSFLRTIDDSTSTVKGHFRISNRLDASDYALYTISGTNTEATGYHKVNCGISTASAVSFSNNEDIIITFARTGTKGDTGNTGAQGVQGAQGHQGVQGAQGHQGVQGATGAQGHQGVQGAQGHQGHQGVQGAQGRQGATGNTGAQGHQGVQGTTGATTTINNNANNRVITGSGSANTLEAESLLTFDGNKLLVASNSYNVLELRADENNDGGNDDSIINFTHDGTLRAEIRYDESSSTLELATSDNRGDLVIDSSGRLQIGASNNSGANTKLVVGAGNNINTTAIINTGDVNVDALTLSNWDGSTTTNKVTIHFDSSGIGGWNIGMPAATDAFVIEDDGGTEKLRITSNSRLLLNTTDNSGYTNRSAYFTNPNDNWNYISITGATNGGAGIVFGDGTGQSAANYESYMYHDNTDNNFHIRTNQGNNWFTFGQSGYLGVGMEAGSTRLDVKQDNGVAYNGNAQTVAYNAARFLNTSGHTSGGTYTGFQFNINGNSQNRICSIGMISEASNSRASSLVFHTDDNGNRKEKLRITSGGKVGIGTINPGTRDTSGSLDIQSNLANNGPYFRVLNTQSTYGGGIQQMNNNAVGGLQFLNASGTSVGHFYHSTGGWTWSENLQVMGSAGIRIGTTSGSELLVIKRNDATGPTITLENNSNKAYINNWGSTGGGSGRTNRFEINASNQAQASICAPYITFMAGGVGDANEKVRITSTGRVGVNETSPDHMFHIKGTSGNNDPILAVESSTWASGRSAAIRLAYTDGNAREISGSYDSGLHFTTNNGEAMRITADGTCHLAYQGGNTNHPKVKITGTQHNFVVNNWGNSDGDYWNFGSNIESNSGGSISKSSNTTRASGVTIDGRMGRIIIMTSQTSTSNIDEHFEFARGGEFKMRGGDILWGPDEVSQMEATIRSWGASLWFTTIDSNYYHDSGGEFRQFYNKGSFRGDNYLTCYDCSIATNIGYQNRSFWKGGSSGARAEGSLDISVGYRGAFFFIGRTSANELSSGGHYLFDRSSSRCSVSWDSFGNNMDGGELSFHCGNSAGYNSGDSSMGGRIGSSNSDGTMRLYAIGCNMENYNAPNSKRAGNHLGLSVINDDGTDYTNTANRLSTNLINNSTGGGTNNATGEFNWGNRHSNDRGTNDLQFSQLIYFDDVQLNVSQWDYLEHYFKYMYGKINS